MIKSEVCFSLTCDECEEYEENGDGGKLLFSSEDSAKKYMANSGEWIEKDGKHICGFCKENIGVAQRYEITNAKEETANGDNNAQ